MSTGFASISVSHSMTGQLRGSAVIRDGESVIIGSSQTADIRADRQSTAEVGLYPEHVRITFIDADSPLERKVRIDVLNGEILVGQARHSSGNSLELTQLQVRSNNSTALRIHLVGRAYLNIRIDIQPNK